MLEFISRRKWECSHDFHDNVVKSGAQEGSRLSSVLVPVECGAVTAASIGLNFCAALDSPDLQGCQGAEVPWKTVFQLRSVIGAGAESRGTPVDAPMNRN